MALPQGTIVHRTSSRMRIRFSEKRNEAEFFKNIEKSLKDQSFIKSLRSNPLTASLLLEGDFSDVGKLADYAKSQNLFLLDTASAAGVPLRSKVYQSFDSSNRFVKDHTRNELDLPVMIFLMLVGSGIYQLFRYGARLPPWYTAFWYALGVFTKSMSDSETDMDAGDDGGE